MKQNIRREKLILETVQMGGTLVFLNDAVPVDFSKWLQPLQTHFLGEIPFVKRHAQDLLTGAFETKSQDLVFFFLEQSSLVESLNSVLQGQRVLLGENKDGAIDHLVDFAWSSCDLQVWTSTFNELRSLWAARPQLSKLVESHMTPCLFLDRDDVVVKNIPYNKDPDKVQLLPGIESLINKAHDCGYWVALVTNQSGLGRGLITWGEYQKVHQKTLQLLAEKGCWLDESVWAGYIENPEGQYGGLLASQRKPRVGMFQAVNAKLRVNMNDSVMVGDSATDLIAAFGAGVRNLYLLSSDKMEKENQKLLVYKSQHADLQFQIATSFDYIKFTQI